MSDNIKTPNNKSKHANTNTQLKVPGKLKAGVQAELATKSKRTAIK